MAHLKIILERRVIPFLISFEERKISLAFPRTGHAPKYKKMQKNSQGIQKYHMILIDTLLDCY